MGGALGMLWWAVSVGAADTGGWAYWKVEGIDIFEECAEGETQPVSAIVDNPDDVPLVFEWTQDASLTDAGFDGLSGDLDSDTISLTCPPCSISGATDEITYSIYMVVVDPDGNTDWAFTDFTVVCDGPDADGDPDADDDDDVDPGCDAAPGCSATPLGAATSAGAWLLLLGLRRRQA